MVVILAATICRALFGQYYVSPISTTECDYILRAACDRNIMHDADHISERAEIARWIASYISLLGDDTPLIDR